jgi:ribosomal protein S18 acetylase RimI-like enzyme
MFFIQVLLLAVDNNEREKGYGTKLMEFVGTYYNKIVVYSDYASQKFYQKLGFKTNIHLFNQIKDKLLCEINCIFMCYGFDDVNL